jgi:3-oxoacyl-[acyl-carrier-protein] synthase-3
MNGMAIFGFSSKTAPATIKNALAKNNADISDITYFILHQASKAIIDNIRSKLSLERGRVPSNFHETGNTASSTIPIILTEKLRGEKMKRGSKILLAGFGAGLSWASVVLTVADEFN